MTHPEVTRSLSAAPPAATTHSITSSLGEAVREVWQSRELLYQLMLRDIRIRYKQAVMGFGWALLMPLLIVGAGLMVRLALTTTGVTASAAGLAGTAAKGICWAFFSGAVGFGTASLIANMNLISKVYFPREVLPLAAVGAQTFDSLIATAALALALPFLGAVLSPALLWLPLLAILLATLTSAAALFLSCANLFLRDVKYIVQLFLTFGIFFTPVLFEPAMLGPVGAKLIMLNPLAPILEGVRLALVGHNLLQPLVEQTSKGLEVLAWQPWYLLYSAGWAVGGLAIAMLIFHRLEFIFAEYL